MEKLNRTNTQKELENLRKDARSCWRRGVIDYAIELLDNVDNWELLNLPTLEKTLLNGASDWNEYSDGGCALIYDGDIADRLCTPSELKRKKGGELPPNSQENWLDTQARALRQAYFLIEETMKGAKK